VSLQFNIPEGLDFHQENYENLRSWNFFTRFYLFPYSFCKYTHKLFLREIYTVYVCVIHIDKHLDIMTEYCQLPHLAELPVCNVRLDTCLLLFDVSENLTVKTGLPEDGAYER
jgi:hypothetical protein